MMMINRVCCLQNPTPPLATAPVLALGGTNPPTNPTPKHTQPSTSGTVSPTQPQHDRYPTPENPVTENPPTNSGSPTYNDTPASTTKKKGQYVVFMSGDWF